MTARHLVQEQATHDKASNHTSQSRSMQSPVRGSPVRLVLSRRSCTARERKRNCSQQPQKAHAAERKRSKVVMAPGRRRELPHNPIRQHHRAELPHSPYKPPLAERLTSLCDALQRIAPQREVLMAVANSKAPGAPGGRVQCKLSRLSRALRHPDMVHNTTRQDPRLNGFPSSFYGLGLIWAPEAAHRMCDVCDSDVG